MCTFAYCTHEAFVCSTISSSLLQGCVLGSCGVFIFKGGNGKLEPIVYWSHQVAQPLRDSHCVWVSVYGCAQEKKEGRQHFTGPADTWMRDPKIISRLPREEAGSTRYRYVRTPTHTLPWLEFVHEYASLWSKIGHYCLESIARVCVQVCLCASLSGIGFRIGKLWARPLQGPFLERPATWFFHACVCTCAHFVWVCAQVETSVSNVCCYLRFSKWCVMHDYPGFMWLEDLMMGSSRIHISSQDAPLCKCIWGPLWLPLFNL